MQSAAIAHAPASEAEAATMIAAAYAARQPLEILGGGSKRGLGRPVQVAASLSTGALTGVTLHEPAELVIGARAGTPLSDLTAALDAAGQMLAFEPPDYRALLGVGDAVPTVGGLVATNLSGPRRIMSGACRDALIGVRFVNGRGEALSSGGRVMKNVTGYDLVKLLAGSHGTLGLITEAIFKVVPRPEATASLVWQGLDDVRAVDLMSRALGSPFEVSAAAHLPARGHEPAKTILRLENFAASVIYRRDRVARELAGFGAAQGVEAGASQALWTDIRDARPLLGVEGAIWRVSLAPSKSPGFVRAVSMHERARFVDWGGGLVWLATDESEAAGEAVQAAARACGGHAMLMRGPDALRQTMAFMPPASAGVAALSGRIRAAMDPGGILNPGRMGF